MHSFKDPPGHVLPERSCSVSAIVLDPRLRRIAFWMPTAMVALIVISCVLALPMPHPGVRTNVLYVINAVVLVLMWWFLYDMSYASSMRAARRDHPQAVRLAQTKVGLALLEEGDVLHERRGHLAALMRNRFPLDIAFVVDAMCDGSDAANPIDRVWEHQLALERDLADRQRRHLAGEPVGIIGHLGTPAT